MLCCFEHVLPELRQNFTGNIMFEQLVKLLCDLAMLGDINTKLVSVSLCKRCGVGTADMTDSH